jgi:catechol 2,3-dioxygenase-like lactoylglutathione lyase family enzyme
VIRGAHVILYSSDAEADRAFLQGLLGLGEVDAGGGWLILQLPPGEVAVHPAETSGAVELYLVCDDVDQTVTELSERGVVVEGPVSDQGWGRLATIRLPGGGRLGLYEARHPTAFDL